MARMCDYMSSGFRSSYLGVEIMITTYTYRGTESDGLLWFQPTVIVDFTYWNQSHVGRICENFLRSDIYASFNDIVTESIVMVNDLLV